MEAIEAFILAGGKSSRFGSDKTLHQFGGKPLIEHVTDRLQGLFHSISIVANDSNKYNYLAIPVYSDIIPGLGPLGGIYTALQRSATYYIFVCAADMPFLNQEFITFMLQIPRIYDCIIPRWKGNTEPLHAIYSKRCIPHIETLIQNKTYKISYLFEKVVMRYIDDDELIVYTEDPSQLFYNINRPGDIHPFQ
ncbi:MAG: molybdenum cofactor guanylyltransferase [Spirochaetes bacterium]|nr:molybdenum cofactor guanylyltransferase [Spirochaetota bacterium]